MSPNLVELRNLKVAFDGIQVLHGIDLDVKPGEALGLVGESGCGKSVTWLAALGRWFMGGFDHQWSPRSITE